MKLWVNGEEREVAAECTVAQLLEELEVVRNRVAVEVNRHVVRRADHESHRLQAGDKVEIVHFVGGGGPQLR